MLPSHYFWTRNNTSENHVNTMVYKHGNQSVVCSDSDDTATVLFNKVTHL